MRYIWLYIVAIVASLGGLLSGYDTGVISGALLFINETWVLPDTLQGFLVSMASFLKHIYLFTIFAIEFCLKMDI